jgi:hypothetical protein
LCLLALSLDRFSMSSFHGEHFLDRVVLRWVIDDAGVGRAHEDEIVEGMSLLDEALVPPSFPAAEGAESACHVGAIPLGDDVALHAYDRFFGSVPCLFH